MSDDNDANSSGLKVRVNGPYKHGRKWRCVEVRGDGEVETVSFESEADARAYVEAARRVSVGITLGAAVTEYLAWMQEAPGRGGRARRDSTVKLTAWRLRGLLRLSPEEPEMEALPLYALTRAKMRSLWALREAEVKVDTLSGELVTLRRAVAHWLKKGWCEQDPTIGLEVKGSRSVGKPQLRSSEARRFLAVALEQGVEGLAAAMALLTGMRASEITDLIVRDIDDGMVWVTKAKTRRGIRRLEIPGELLPRLLKLCEGRGPAARLWGDVDRHWLRHHVVRICGLAGVPVVTPHGLRGTFATLAVGAGDTRRAAETLGHDKKMTEDVYAAPGAVQSGMAKVVASQLLGGHHEGNDRGTRRVADEHHHLGRGGRHPVLGEGDHVRADHADGRANGARHGAGVHREPGGQPDPGTEGGARSPQLGVGNPGHGDRVPAPAGSPALQHAVGHDHGGRADSVRDLRRAEVRMTFAQLVSRVREASALVTPSDETLPGQFDLTDVTLN